MCMRLLLYISLHSFLHQPSPPTPLIFQALFASTAGAASARHLPFGGQDTSQQNLSAHSINTFSSPEEFKVLMRCVYVLCVHVCVSWQQATALAVLQRPQMKQPTSQTYGHQVIPAKWKYLCLCGCVCVCVAVKEICNKDVKLAWVNGWLLFFFFLLNSRCLCTAHW